MQHYVLKFEERGVYVKSIADDRALTTPDKANALVFGDGSDAEGMSKTLLREFGEKPAVEQTDAPVAVKSIPIPKTIFRVTQELG